MFILTPETQAHLVIEAFGVAVSAGFYIATVRHHGDRLNQHDAKLEKQDDTLGVHDRELGNVYGRLLMTREVRR